MYIPWESNTCILNSQYWVMVDYAKTCFFEKTMVFFETLKIEGF